MLNQLFSLNARRQRLLKRAPPGPLKDFLSIPFPEPNRPIELTPILAVDFETTGLDCQRDKLLSVGFIGIEHNEILLSSAYHKIIHIKDPLKEENVIIHKITDSAKREGEPLETVIGELLGALAGKVMLVHYAQIEKIFLERCCKQLYGMAPVFPVIDTLAIAKKRLDKMGGAYQSEELRLSNLLEHHALPAHQAHNALSDALATAEVLMAEIELMRYDSSPPLKKLLL